MIKPVLPGKNLVRRTAPVLRARSFDHTSDRPSPIENLLSQKEQEELQAIATVLEFRRGGLPIFSEGEDAHFVYSVDEGVVRIGRHAENGKRQILAFMVPGDLFGLPQDGIYVNTAETVSASRLYRYSWHKLRDIMKREPELQLHLLIRVAHDLRQAQRQVMILGQQNTTQRLASFLLDFIRHPEFFDERKKQLQLPISHFDLADYLGTARETVARTFAKLERGRLLKRQGAESIEILDIGGLRALHNGRRRNG